MLIFCAYIYIYTCYDPPGLNPVGNGVSHILQGSDSPIGATNVAAGNTPVTSV